MKKAILAAAALLICLGGNDICAQEQPRWSARIDTVGVSGYYNINLSPMLVGLSHRSGFEDMRILDDTGGEVPYIVRRTNPVREVERMKMYTLLHNAGKDSVNVLIVDNTARERIDCFYIVMREADVEMTASVRGGGGDGRWYVVKQRTSLIGRGAGDGNEVAVLDIPEGYYDRYEITITNNQGSPLSIEGVGRMDREGIYGQYTKVDPGRFSVREDSMRRTVITFPDLDKRFLIDRIEVNIASRGLFRRDAELVTGKRSVDMSLSSSLSVSPQGGNVFSVDRFPVDSTTRIVIFNGDNPPLAVDSVRLWGLARYLCARLEAGRRYTLVVGAEGLSRYDLEYFRDELGEQLPIVSTSDPVREDIASVPSQRVWFFERPGFLWVVMALVGAILIVVCIQALRSTRKAEN